MPIHHQRRFVQRILSFRLAVRPGKAKKRYSFRGAFKEDTRKASIFKFGDSPFGVVPAQKEKPDQPSSYVLMKTRLHSPGVCDIHVGCDEIDIDDEQPHIPKKAARV